MVILRQVSVTILQVSEHQLLSRACVHHPHRWTRVSVDTMVLPQVSSTRDPHFEEKAGILIVRRRDAAEHESPE